MSIQFLLTANRDRRTGFSGKTDITKFIPKFCGYRPRKFLRDYNFKFTPRHGINRLLFSNPRCFDCLPNPSVILAVFSCSLFSASTADDENAEGAGALSIIVSPELGETSLSDSAKPVDNFENLFWVSRELLMADVSFAISCSSRSSLDSATTERRDAACFAASSNNRSRVESSSRFLLSSSNASKRRRSASSTSTPAFP